MLAPERRSRRDLLAAVAIVVVLAVAAGIVWVRSDARATTSDVASAPLQPLVPATAVPTGLRQLWAAPSGATAAPVVVAGAVVTGDGRTVSGRDPATGEVRWSYTRDLELCAVAGQWERAVSVYRDSDGCGQVTSLQGDTGARGPQRSSNNDDAVTLSGDGTYLAAVGSTRLELWRSDLVRTLEYGRVDQLVSPRAQPRSGCTLRSYASTTAVATVVQSCPGDATDRMSLLDPAPSDGAMPQEKASVLLPSSGGRVLVTTAGAEAVLLPGTAGAQPQVALFDTSGVLTSQYAVPLTATDLASLGAGPVLRTTDTGTVTTIAIGGTLLALKNSDLSLAWSTTGVLGSGTVVAGTLLVPTSGALTTLDATTGTVGATSPLDRAGYTGPVELSSAGSVLLEQRGPTLVAYGSG